MSVRDFFFGSSVPKTYTDELRTEILSFTRTASDQKPESVSNFLQASADNTETDWDSMIRMQVDLIQSLPEPQLRLKYLRLRDELVTLTGEGFSSTFLATIPSDSANLDLDTTKAQCVDMIWRVQRLRRMRLNFDRVRTYITLLATMILVVFSSYIVIHFLNLTSTKDPNSLFATTMLVLAGMLGACVSALSRLYSVSWISGFVTGVNSLSQFFWGLALNFVTAVIEGGIFAVLLYLAFMAQFVSGALFPVFQEQPNEPLFHRFFEAGLKTHSDFAKALVWAFIAGFSERLVPDFLSTLGPQLKSTAK